MRLRLYQHKSDVRIRPQSTALAKHSNDTGHIFNYDETKILNIEKNYKKRMLLEALFIKTDKNSCNYRCDTADLPSEYTSILKNFTKTNK